MILSTHSKSWNCPLNLSLRMKKLLFLFSPFEFVAKPMPARCLRHNVIQILTVTKGVTPPKARLWCTLTAKTWSCSSPKWTSRLHLFKSQFLHPLPQPQLPQFNRQRKRSTRTGSSRPNRTPNNSNALSKWCYDQVDSTLPQRKTGSRCFATFLSPAPKSWTRSHVPSRVTRPLPARRQLRQRKSRKKIHRKCHCRRRHITDITLAKNVVKCRPVLNRLDSATIFPTLSTFWRIFLKSRSCFPRRCLTWPSWCTRRSSSSSTFVFFCLFKTR